MTRVRSGSRSCGDLVRYMLNAASASTSAGDKFAVDDDDNNDAYSEDVNNIFLNFENSEPTSSERYLFQVLEEILENAGQLVADIEDYGNGATAHIKTALQNPDDDRIQSEAFVVVSAYAARIKAYHQLALQIQEVMPNLLWELCSGPLPPAEQIDASQALCRQLARIVDFVFRFDCAKMCTPAIQNDFSYYRRAFARAFPTGYAYHSASAEPDTASEPVVGPELATKISMFLANPTPMLHLLSKATVIFVKDHPDLPVTNTTETLVTIVQICRQMLGRKDFQVRLPAETREFVQRVMVGALILFDHVDGLTQGAGGSGGSTGSTTSRAGAFTRHSPIDLRAVVEVIRRDENEQRVEQLLNALRYTSKHFNDSDTPKSIKALLS